MKLVQKMMTVSRHTLQTTANHISLRGIGIAGYRLGRFIIKGILIPLGHEIVRLFVNLAKWSVDIRAWTFAVFATIAIALATMYMVMPHVHNVYSVAKLIDGESRGESVQGQKAVFATLLQRIADKRFPSTIHAVAWQPYPKNPKLFQYNAMGDEYVEDLSTEGGQAILWRTTWWYAQYQMGIFRAPKEARGAHSYCVPEACERQKGYFGRLTQIGKIGNHVFYGDHHAQRVVVSTKNMTAVYVSPRPKARPSRGTESALKQSPRPRARPAHFRQSIVLTEQVEQQIDRLVAQAVAEQ
ncbi:MAG: hypothetical protein ACI92I_000139 [Acidimicrobiales bacterium]|jgi:hypothetical protein